jgi:NitT/TauT family transport system permease protein
VACLEITEQLREKDLLLFASGLTDPDLSLAASAHLFAAAGLERPAALNGPQYLAMKFRPEKDVLPVPRTTGASASRSTKARCDGCTDPAADPARGVLAFLLVWEIAVPLFKMPVYLLPPPSAIIRVFIDEFPKLAFHGWVTLYEMLLGYALGGGGGDPARHRDHSSERFDRFTMPTLLFFQVVPKVAIAPLFLVWFGVGALPKVLVAFLISFFPDRDRRRGRPALDVGRDARPRALDGREPHAGVRAVPPADQPAVPVQRPEGRRDARRGRRGGRRVRRRRQGLGYLLLVTNSNSRPR